MADQKNFPGPGTDGEKMNKHFQSLLGKYPNSADIGTEPIHDNPHNAPTSGQHPEGPMKGHLMTWTQMLEAMEIILESMNEMVGGDVSMEPITDEPSPAEGSPDKEKELLDKLNRIFTPILVMQGYENDIAQKVQESCQEAEVFSERNIIQFDDATRMAQLISTCAILLQQQKNTQNYQLYAKASAIRNQTKINMQKEEYDAAKALAQKYLVMVSTSNNSPVARDAATSLLPETQH